MSRGAWCGRGGGVGVSHVYYGDHLKPFPTQKSLEKQRPGPILREMTYEEIPEPCRPHLGHLFDPANPMALVHFLPKNITDKLLELCCTVPDLLEHLSDDENLKTWLYNEYKYRPTVNDHRIRYLFWVEYENALLENRKMVLHNVHSLVCDPKAFTSLFLKLPQRAVFLLCRPAAYQHSLREMLVHGLERMRQILDLPEVDPNGKINTKIIELKLKVVAMVDMRVNGAPTQKIHQITQNIPTVGAGDKKDIKTLVQKADMNTIQKRIEEIEAEKRRLEGREYVRVPAAPVEK